ncbi:hypothetical protein GF362_00645 [Candidatus Dojkabacteria bacterium]|nr:hypothetical protein [Candidatus Dojkabacteria bacterium]
MHVEQFLQESEKTLASPLNFKRDDFQLTLLYGATRIAVEGSEILDHIHNSVFRESDIDKAHLEEELGDLMYAVGIILRSLDFDLETIMDKQIQKNELIFGDEGYNADLWRSRDKKSESEIFS